MHVGGVRLALVTLDAPVEAPMPLFGFSLLVATPLSLFVEHSAFSRACCWPPAPTRACRRRGD
eukprot:2877750-Prymnesium_polylepis.1